MKEFERNMAMLADTEQHPGRWVLVPRKEEKFLGARARAYVRARERRRRVFTVLVESLGITALIGLFPPLRAMWVVTGIIALALSAYVMFLLHLKAQYEADIEDLPKQAVPVREEPEILENELRILSRPRRHESVLELPPNVRVYAAQ